MSYLTRATGTHRIESSCGMNIRKHLFMDMYMDMCADMRIDKCMAMSIAGMFIAARAATLPWGHECESRSFARGRLALAALEPCTAVSKIDGRNGAERSRAERTDIRTGRNRAGTERSGGGVERKGAERNGMDGHTDGAERSGTDIWTDIRTGRDGTERSGAE